MYIFSKYNIFAKFFKILSIFSNTHHGRGFGTICKHGQSNLPYPSTNSKCVVPIYLLLTSQHDSNNYCGLTTIAHKRTFSVSNVTNKTQVDTDRNNDDNTKSFATPIKHNYRTPKITDTTTTTNPFQDTANPHLFQISSTTTTALLKLPPSGKGYLCFHSDGKSDHTSQCSKSRASNKVICLIIDVASFEKRCVVLKGFFHSDQLKQHIITIGIYQSLSNSSLYKHRCLKRSKNIHICW